MWLFLLLLGILAWFVMRHLAAERQARELAMAQHRAALALEVRQHQRDLSSFEHEQDGVRWEFDFDNMTVSMASAPGDADDAAPCDLKRSDGGVWHYRVPEAANRRRIEALKRDASDESHADRGNAQRELEALGEQPQWIAVPDALSAKVESRYERFLRHYKG